MTRFYPSRQANGWATIEIDPYEYSRDFLQRIVDRVGTLGAGTRAEVGSDGLDTYMADFVVAGAAASAFMDNWGCSIAFDDDAVRDRILALLTKPDE